MYKIHTTLLVTNYSALILLNRSKKSGNGESENRTLNSRSGKPRARARARRSAVSCPVARDTRTTHHRGPSRARRSRLSSSVHDALGFFFGLWRSRSSTSSLQFALPARLSRLSCRSCRRSLAVSSPPPPQPPPPREKVVRGGDNGGGGDKEEEGERVGRERG